MHSSVFLTHKTEIKLTLKFEIRVLKPMFQNTEIIPGLDLQLFLYNSILELAFGKCQSKSQDCIAHRTCGNGRTGHSLFQ